MKQKLKALIHEFEMTKKNIHDHGQKAYINGDTESAQKDFGAVVAFDVVIPKLKKLVDMD